MPELPEVETVRRGLSPWIVGRKIKKLEVLHRGANRKSTDRPLSSAEGARIVDLRRRGKFLWFVLDQDFALVGHLGMSGQMLIRPRNSQFEKHLKVRMDMGDKKNEFRFVDQRTFGWMAIDELVDRDGQELPQSMVKIAPDVFAENFDKKQAMERILRSSSQIKKVLLDQGIISGIGNIYADEALWRSRIHPERISASLSESDVRNLISSVKTVMTRALKEGGTSFDDLYINVNGESGYFEVSLNAYGREGEPCRRCRAQIRRIAFANRSSHFCPTCQQKRGKKRGAITGRKGRTH